ncbi:hypothetical protein AMEX_G20668 [Astyanax mexicanus]|uniref:Uncharacterized protein n=1 Tax=Astyanax mexicanus TaxID=7994 RepID=A0A8T2L339_ASTMX|nr:hypothetical protein AMEX_G20668 [Astyanax mexicanus]
MLTLVLLLALLPATAQANEEVVEPSDLTQDPPSSAAQGAPVPQCCGMDELTQKLAQLVQEQQENRGWYAEIVKVLNQLVQENKEVATGQTEILKVLRVMRDQQEQHLNHLVNMARLQSLLVENHQALLLQVSRIGSQIQDLNKKQ